MKTLWKRRIRKWHRWLAIIVGIQILFWMLSGVFFAIVPFDRVLGNDMVVAKESLPLKLEAATVAPTAIAAMFSDRSISHLALRNRTQGLVYEVYESGNQPFALVDATSGELLPLVKKEAAIDIALAGHSGTSDSDVWTRYLEGEKPREYFGPMPVWQVHLSDPRKTRIYVSPVTGDIILRRNAYWECFDFFWKLHIMNFDDGFDFNHTLLRVASIAGLVVTLSGYLLWFVSRRRKTKA